MSNSVQSHRQQPTRLLRPWDSPSKNTGVGCHFLLQRMKVKSESEVTQSGPTLSNPMDCSLPGSSIHGISRQEYWSGVPLPSPSLATRKCKLTLQWKYQYLPIRMAKVKVKTKVCEKFQAEKVIHSHTASRNVKWHSHSGKTFCSFSKS